MRQEYLDCLIRSQACSLTSPQHYFSQHKGLCWSGKDGQNVLSCMMCCCSQMPLLSITGKGPSPGIPCVLFPHNSLISGFFPHFSDLSSSQDSRLLSSVSSSPQNPFFFTETESECHFFFVGHVLWLPQSKQCICRNNT